MAAGGPTHRAIFRRDGTINITEEDREREKEKEEENMESAWMKSSFRVPTNECQVGHLGGKQ